MYFLFGCDGYDVCDGCDGYNGYDGYEGYDGYGGYGGYDGYDEEAIDTLDDLRAVNEQIKVRNPKRSTPFSSIWLVPLTRASIDLVADPAPGDYPGWRGFTREVG